MAYRWIPSSDKALARFEASEMYREVNYVLLPQINGFKKVHKIRNDRITYLPTPIYPRVPYPMAKLPCTKKKIPSRPGVYFIWDKSQQIIYVGKSVRLYERINNSQHYAVRQGCEISFLLFDKKDLIYAEHYYIGICIPPLNKG